MSLPNRRSIRRRLVTLTVVPSAALLLLWGVATSVLVDDMFDLRANARFIEDVGEPALDVIGALQTERRFVMEHLGDPDAIFSTVDTFDFTAAGSDLVARVQDETDTVIADFRDSLAGANLGRLSAEAQDRVAQFDAALADLVAQRGVIDADPERTEAVRPYNDTIEAGLQIWDATAELSDSRLAYQAHSLTSLVRGRELLAQEDALLSYALAADTFGPEEHAEFAHAVGAQRFVYTQIAPELRPEEREIYDGVIDSNIYRVVQDLENQVVTAVPSDSASPPINDQPWKVAQGALNLQFQRVEDNRTAALVSDSRGAATALLTGVAAGSVLALAVAVAAALYSVRVTRRISQRLEALRESTLDHAHNRLPAVTERLRAGDSVDVDTEAPELPIVERDEIGEVTEAFNRAQRAAVHAAVDEARLRGGVRSMFRNVARRTQTLVHRQLGVLDTLEQNETDPEALGSLFRIDHLGTQMRRNADNLILLSGARPGRRHRQPLNLQDAVRAACSEIQDYQRVKVLPMPHVALTAQAAGDVIHLLAELLDNATAFSPPHTPVTVRGEALTHGFAVEVEDRGLGMSKDKYDELNQLLASLPDFDLAGMREDSSLGLYVVASIAHRCGIQITLRPSPYNGTQVIVVLPASLTQEPAEPAPHDGAPRMISASSTPVNRAPAAPPAVPRSARARPEPADAHRSLPPAEPVGPAPTATPAPPAGPVPPTPPPVPPAAAPQPPPVEAPAAVPAEPVEPIAPVTPAPPTAASRPEPAAPTPPSPADAGEATAPIPVVPGTLPGEPIGAPATAPPVSAEASPDMAASDGAAAGTYKGLPMRRRKRGRQAAASGPARTTGGPRPVRGDMRDAFRIHTNARNRQAPTADPAPTPEPAPAAGPNGPVEERSLAEIRQMMNNYQLGTRRGRAAGEEPAPGERTEPRRGEEQ